MGDERKIHWQRWEKLTRSKKDGGMGFKDLRALNLAMLAKQGWRLLHDDNSLVYQCLKARYFPRTHFFDAKESPNCSFVWRSIVAALPILKVGCFWRVGNGLPIWVSGDKWIPNYPTSAPLFPLREEVREVVVAELIDPELHAWRSEFILDMFEQADVEAICKIHLSRRDVDDILIWMHHKKGLFTVKFAYKMAWEVLLGGNLAES